MPHRPSLFVSVESVEGLEMAQDRSLSIRVGPHNIPYTGRYLIQPLRLLVTHGLVSEPHAI